MNWYPHKATGLGFIMAKVAKALGALEVKRLTETGQHPVGTVPGLRLFIKPSGSKSWVLRTTIGTKRSDIGLGGYPAVTLAAAWDRARTALSTIREGKNPIAERQSKQAAITWTFKTCALAYIQTHKPSWKNAKHGQQWENTLETYVYPHIGHKHIKDVDTEDVVRVISPFWSTKNETINRVRNRIELVLSWAAAQGYRPKGFNPASWKGHLDQVFSAASKVNKRTSFEAMPIDGMFEFMNRLAIIEGTSARCLAFTILTASRSGESRGALWSEIDFDDASWSIPATRMKAGRAHRIPLSEAALELLAALPRFTDRDGKPVDLVFPGQSGHKPLSDMSLTACMRRMKLTAVPHGFRSTFTDWTAERTSYPSEVREMALAHAIGNDTEAAYRRGDLFDKRRNLMNEWAGFLATAPVRGKNVVSLPTAAQSF
jgi:integrase